MVLLFFMDGIKYEMMEKYMPFLNSLNKKPLISEFGYSCACHATMYTSRFIDEHKTWFIWKKGENSPYKWINYIPGLKYINFLPLKLVIGKVTRKLSRNTSYPGVPCLVNLPLKYWPLFETTEDVFWTDKKYKEDIPNMFTILTENKIKHQIVGLHKGTQKNDIFIEEAQVNYKENNFVYYFIGYTDNIMHKYGEKSKESQEYLSEVDNFIKNTYIKATREKENVTLIAFSDHGHIDIEEPKIDINKYFKKRNLNVNKYVHLIEATFARFWFRNENERKEVIEVLKDIEQLKLGFVLTQEYLDRYHLNLDPKEHGDLTFHLNAPNEFTKTIWGFGKTVKSGHGFEPTLEKHYGIFCSNKNLDESNRFAYLTDILPSVLEQLKINKEKYILRGKNIIDIKKTDFGKEIINGE